MIYLQLFWSFFQVGLMSFGGGYAALPQIQHQVLSNGWLTMTEFTDIVTISEMTPGPIAINAATFVGTRLAGLPGAIAATVGCVVPSYIIVLLFAWLYQRYKNLKGVQGVLETLRPAVVALIAAAGMSILLLALFDGSWPMRMADVNVAAVVLMLLGVVILRIFKVNPIWIIAGSGVVGLLGYATGI